jgi:protein-S-isoprenylcysteine O-methyltransferase Ste14
VLGVALIAAVLAIIIGQALALGRLALLPYAAGVWLLFAAFVRFYEEPALTERYREQYATYRRAVPRWLPRRHAWPP